jgi:RNA polymerase sigma factor (sigma-70 family)
MTRCREGAADAFQAVFLVLARRAAALARDASLAGWLQAVAVRVCLRQRRDNLRSQRRVQEAREVAQEFSRPDQVAELRLVIDEELAALPQRLRDVLVLCDLEGHSREEVARALSVPVGTVSSRLARGREAMRKRLAGHVPSLAAGGVAIALAKCGQAAPAASADLVQTTVRNAHVLMFDTAAANAALSSQITSLAEGVVYAMIISRWKIAVCLVVLLACTLFGGTLAPGVVPGLIGTASAATVFFDDFEDGSATDGSPVTWRPYAEYLNLGNSTFSASTGDYVLTPHSGADVVAAVLDPGVNLANVSIRTQLKTTGIDDATVEGTGLLIRTDIALPNPTGFDCGIESDGKLYIATKQAGFTELASAQSGLSPLTGDVVLQVDVIGNSLRLFAWRPGEPKPQQPQVEAISDYRESGSIGIYYNPPAGKGTATFRYIHVADMPIPEPSSLSLGSLGAAALASLAFRLRLVRAGSLP